MPSAHRASVNAVALLPGGARFVSVGDRDCEAVHLDGAVERTFDLGAYVFCVAALPDGVHFVVGGGYDVRLYHVDGTLVHTFKGHTGHVLGVAVTRDGQHIISGSQDRRVKVWSVATKSLVGDCIGHNSAVSAVAVMPDGKRILSGGNDKTVRRWLLDGTQSDTFRLHAASVRALVALPDNQHALSGSNDRTVKLFNVNDGAVLRTFKHHTTSSSADLPGAAARRPPLRQRLERQDRPHRLPRPRSPRELVLERSDRSTGERARALAGVCPTPVVRPPASEFCVIARAASVDAAAVGVVPTRPARRSRAEEHQVARRRSRRRARALGALTPSARRGRRERASTRGEGAAAASSSRARAPSKKRARSSATSSAYTTAPSSAVRVAPTAGSTRS